MSGNRELLGDWCSPVMPHLVNNSVAVQFPVINWMNHFAADDRKQYNNIREKNKLTWPLNTQDSGGVQRFPKKISEIS